MSLTNDDPPALLIGVGYLVWEERVALLSLTLDDPPALLIGVFILLFIILEGEKTTEI